ncbi:uncharacterized protein [Spinacia oleracea]|uniref:Endonuclease/exonuclease/phosphatase domain-containing protein n=1 Tax=Spinacia oleracea TaxID=3562 RepID=A0ABM3R358_SPIOL|nr:uncharacterized protein LOC130464927 [Spinacia oleracea]
MDSTSPLPDCVWIEDSKGGMFKQAVTYDWLPQYCKVCCTAGHDCTKKTKPPVPKPVAKKVWVPKAVQQAHPMSEQQEQPNAVHTPEMPVNNVSDPTPWKILECEGLNDPIKVPEVKHLIHTHNIHVVALLETRVKESNFSRVVISLGEIGNGKIITLQTPEVHEQFIHCEIRDRYGVVELYVTLVYGLHSIDTRKNLWNSLTTLASSNHGTPVSATETKDFDEFITSNGLCPVKSVGHYFSWHKGTGEGKIASRIDWCLGNDEWIHKFSNVQVEYLNPSISDHSPLLINCLPDNVEGGRPFRFLNYLADHSSFSAIIQAAFTESRLNSRSYIEKTSPGITEKITIARSELDKVQQSLQTGRSPSLLNQEVVCIKQLRHWLRIDEIALRQKSRIQWLKLGDSNNHFFFSTVKERVRFNSIAILYDDNGTKLVDPDLIQTEILSFYKKLLGTSANTLPSIHIPTVRNGSRLNNDARQDLCRDVTDDEIDLALHGIGNDKAPGPDGLNAVFSKRLGLSSNRIFIEQ